MTRFRIMQRFARWHIWLGWLIAVPLLLWCASGLLMVARPIDEVRGTDLRIDAPEQPLPANFAPALAFLAPGQPGVAKYAVTMRFGAPVARVDYRDGSTALFDAANGLRLTPLSEAAARDVARRGIKGGSQVASARVFAANDVPFDFRKPLAVWKITLTNGTYIYVGRDTGEIEAVRTRFWRVYDFMWGLHIMDPATRENTHHPLLIGFAALALVSVVLGTALLFRRRRSSSRR